MFGGSSKLFTVDVGIEGRQMKMSGSNKSHKTKSRAEQELSELFEAAENLPGVKEVMELYEGIEKVERLTEAYAQLMDARLPISPSDTSGPMIWKI